MTAEDRLQNILGPSKACPICAGSGVDPIQRSHTGELPAPCRSCKGTKLISRIKVINPGAGPETNIIIREEVRDNGALVTHHMPMSNFADAHREVLEREQADFTHQLRLEEIKPDVCKVMQGCIDVWIGEGRG